ncbi:hypothetical protein EVAR_29283_1 [Eumeta japonica]|uniref:Uncharacterized protein n=1 Tax=Eumeta variegata TaxID=151549 RepID=A0A4C1VVA0_EUMVA|nr:hypothetical protein EVAR_29283_1 [Eumeta japonica]
MQLGNEDLMVEPKDESILLRRASKARRSSLYVSLRDFNPIISSGLSRRGARPEKITSQRETSSARGTQRSGVRRGHINRESVQADQLAQDGAARLADGRRSTITHQCLCRSRNVLSLPHAHTIEVEQFMEKNNMSEDWEWGLSRKSVNSEVHSALKIKLQYKQQCCKSPFMVFKLIYLYLSILQNALTQAHNALTGAPADHYAYCFTRPICLLRTPFPAACAYKARTLCFSVTL